MPGGCDEGVHAALRSPAFGKYALPASETPAAPLVAVLQGMQHDRPACCQLIDLRRE